MHEVGLGLPEIPVPRGTAVVPEVDVFAPESLQQLVVSPAIVGVGDAGGAVEGTVTP